MHLRRSTGEEMAEMYTYERSDENLSTVTDAYYEERASQEEIYNEEREEEIRMILEFGITPPPPPCESLSQERIETAEELIIGDSDDPPLSEDALDEMLSKN